VYSVHDWADVHRLHREGLPQAAIARRLQMSRNTVGRLLKLSEPPKYERRPQPSLLDPQGRGGRHAGRGSDSAVHGHLEHLRRDAYAGGRTALKDRLARIRPQFLAARAYERTTYFPGEIGQADWWHTRRKVRSARATREAFGLVTALPRSAAHAVVYTVSRTTADVLPALLGCLARLAGRRRS